MALPQDGQNANGLTKVTKIPAGKALIFIDPTSNDGGIITIGDIAAQILDNLASKTFGLDQGVMTLPDALNQLNKKIQGGTTTTTYTFTSADFEAGAYNAAGEKIENPKTIRTITTYTVTAGDYIQIKKVDKDQTVAAANFYDNGFHDLNYWTNADSTVNIDHDGELIVLISNNSGANMVPDDYVEQVYLIRG